jgi:hypothetical protein
VKEKTPLGNPLIGEPRGGQAASPCGHCPSTLSQRCGGSAKEVDSGRERKKRGRRWSAGHQYLWPTGHSWPPLNPYFHLPLHLAPIMLIPLTKSIKSKENSFYPFLKFYLFIMFFEIFGFILCNDEVNMLWKRSK